MKTIDLIKKDLSKVPSLKDFKDKIELDFPKDPKFGDYSTNVAMRMAKSGEKPVEIAEKIKKELQDLNLDYIEKIEVASPGFINFFLSKVFLITQLSNLLDTSKKTVKTGQTIVVEYTDPNPFKEFHIGHLYSNIVGESIARTREYLGTDVKRVCYQGDVGLHVAKAIFGMQKKMKDQKLNLKDIEEKPIDERIKFLGESYALGDREYEKNEAKNAINDLNRKIYYKDPEILSFYEKGRKWSLEYFDLIYKRLGTSFDKFYFESDAGKKGLQIVKEHLKDGVFEESDGAIIFDAQRYGLHKRVFVNSMGLPTYEAKELGLAVQKNEDFHYDLSIIVTAAEITEYFKVLIKALSLIYPDLAKRTVHIGHGFVKLPAGKMSSRSGNVLTAQWLLDESVSAVKKQFEDMDAETAEKVGVGAVKYSLLKSGIGRDVVFNFEESISLEGNSGPYLQYSYVRAKSVLARFAGSSARRAKAKEELFSGLGLKTRSEGRQNFSNFKPEVVGSGEEGLLKKLVKFNDQTFFTDDFSQHNLCNYLYELASIFNLFYAKNPILKSENEGFRLALTKAVANILEQGLGLLGIETPSRM